MNFAIIGGDARSAYAADRLTAAGHRVRCHHVPYRPDYSAADALGRADVVLLPIPTKTLPIPAAELPPHARIFVGAPSPEVTAALAGREVVDLLSMESLAVENAALTARAAAVLLQQHLPRTLAGEPVLILGAGRIGKLLGLELKHRGAAVTVAARDPAQQAWCKALGLEAVDITSTTYPSIVLNTIPARVLPLEALPSHSLLMELASAPGGFDPADAAARGHTVIPAGGLPGKHLPESAGAIIAEAILAGFKQ